LKTHLDGARLFNAAVATQMSLEELSAPFDSVSICFSKGLGAPVGSLLAGTTELVRDARRARKLFGGGMRQVGILAAAAQYALQHNVSRLADDHAHAKLLGEAVASTRGLSLPAAKIETNMVIFRVSPELGTSVNFVSRLAEHGIGALPFGPQLVRLVTHMDVSQAQILQACDVLKKLGASN
ncbi:MAG: low specificity L-threonine aldolase, partial [Pirellulaceae bacterium]|nr:low specificity L-threonine aldolase [Pirellulaceae bacterium]